ncbi:hypothetical protein GALMADRAFT_120316 [Galerina marginata CBS 339.88]|uniref:Wax synthase domain-containing protein n=1 Tax=Galerina marginata (strain CBS 339.88) TaxID=685588 RepID=A0A067TDX9_GALM3|nr:hypothetical protein GALMADRAFT_120316 [Galerina marginata CBS 339.88]
MLFLVVLYFLHSTTSAAPIFHVLRDAIPSNLSSPSDPCTCPDQRSLWDILWSCLATIFACTWVSVHPNIPPLRESWLKTGLRRVELMAWALIAPELIILWAMKQWVGARNMVQKYQGAIVCHPWTKTHAYFIQMGGFTLFEAGKPKEVLLPGQMERLLLAGKIDLPQITEEDIQDRSKGDGLAKALVVGQTSWFVAQCIARQAQGLILTELELVTGAFAALNGVMYFLWWNKPLGVRCSVPVHLLDKAKPEEERFKFRDTKGPAIKSWPWDAMSVLVVTTYYYWGTIGNISFKGLRKAMIPIITSPWIRLRSILSSEPAQLKVPGSVSTVSTFYASTDYITFLTDGLLVPSFTWTVAALFGGLHCAAWFFVFPSHAESMIWRVCSAAVLIIPVGILLGFILNFFEDNATPNSGKQIFFRVLQYPLALAVFCLPVYVAARLILLAEAFVALRYLPSGALDVVDWLSFLPHI